MLPVCTKLGVPPPPSPSESLDWRGVCKNGLQNLERLRVRGQNLYNKGVAASFAEALSTASALTMICCLNFEVKVGCHKSGMWKKSKIPTLRQAQDRLSRKGREKWDTQHRMGKQASFGAGVARRRWCRREGRGACAFSRSRLSRPEGRRIRIRAGIGQWSFR